MSQGEPERVVINLSHEEWWLLRTVVWGANVLRGATMGEDNHSSKGATDTFKSMWDAVKAAARAEPNEPDRTTVP